MKKITVCLLPVFLFIFLTGQNLFASAPETENHVQNISHMLGNRGLKKNFNDIYTEAGFLSFGEKQQLYSSFEDKPLAPFLLNWLIGFGIGSFVQKDYLSGGLCLAADITSSILKAKAFGPCKFSTISFKPISSKANFIKLFLYTL